MNEIIIIIIMRHMHFDFITACNYSFCYTSNSCLHAGTCTWRLKVTTSWKVIHFYQYRCKEFWMNITVNYCTLASGEKLKYVGNINQLLPYWCQRWILISNDCIFTLKKYCFSLIICTTETCTKQTSHQLGGYYWW